MRKFFFVLALILCYSVTAQQPVNAMTNYWQNVQGGYWDVGSNWATGSMPLPSDPNIPGSVGDDVLVIELWPSESIIYRNPLGHLGSYGNVTLGSVIGNTSFYQSQDRLSADWINIGSNSPDFTYTIANGELHFNNSMIIGPGEGDTGLLEIYDGATVSGSSATLTVGDNGAGYLHLYGGILSNTVLTLGHGVTGWGKYLQSGGAAFFDRFYTAGAYGEGSLIVNGGIFYYETTGEVGSSKGQSFGTLHLGGTGRITYHPEWADWRGDYNWNTLNIGPNTASPGMVNQYGQTVADIGQIYVGQYADGSYEISGGTVTTGNMMLGHYATGVFTQTGGLVDIYALPCPDEASQEELWCPFEFIPQFRGELRMGSTDTGHGVYILHNGELQTNWTTVGEHNSASFLQDGGSHRTGQLVIAGDQWELQYIDESQGVYVLDGGQLETVDTTVGRKGSDWQNDHMTTYPGGRFVHQDGNHLVSDTLVIGDGAIYNYDYQAYTELSSGAYSQSGGWLETAKTVVGREGKGSFAQTGGTHTTCNLTIAEINQQAGSIYELSGGTLQAGSIINNGDFIYSDGALELGSICPGAFENIGTLSFDGNGQKVIAGEVVNYGDVRVNSTPVRFEGTFTNENVFYGGPELTTFTDLTLSDQSLLVAQVGNEPTIKIDGQITFAGVLDVVDPDGLLPATDGSVAVIFDLTGAQVSGSFDQINLPQITAGLCWDVSGLTNTGQIVIKQGEGGLCSAVNSPPHADLSGSGVYEIGSVIPLASDLSDYDGDLLVYEWSHNLQTICSGTVQAPQGGQPIPLDECSVDALSLGTQTFDLVVSDGVNQELRKTLVVEVVDTGVPTLAPKASKGILWPPNHKMVDVVLWPNASDISGAVSVDVTVSSNEPEDGLGDGDTGPDWSDPVLNTETGEIHLRLRAERSGRGRGRTYTLHFSATDSSGNRNEAELFIVVPHDKSKK